MTQEKKPKQSDDALRRLGDLQRLGQALFEREAGRLARKHGVDDPRTQRMIRTASGAGEMLSALEIVRDNVPVTVAVAEGETVVYGRVIYADMQGAANVEVMIEDAGGRVMRAAGSAVTDASGRYLLRIPTVVAKRLSGKEYILTARNASGELIHRSPDAVKLDLNKAINTDLGLGARQPIRRPSSTRPATPSQPDSSTGAAIFSVGGQVFGVEGKPVAGVLVRIYDKDVKYDDLLGAALTNRNGEFSATYRFQDFSEGEEAADLYFVVVGGDDEVLLSTAADVRYDAERELSVTLHLTK